MEIRTKLWKPSKGVAFKTYYYYLCHLMAEGNAKGIYESIRAEKWWFDRLKPDAQRQIKDYLINNQAFTERELG